MSKYEVRFHYWGRGLQATIWIWSCKLPSWESLKHVRENGFWIKDDCHSGVAEYHGMQQEDSTMWVPPSSIVAIVPL